MAALVAQVPGQRPAEDALGTIAGQGILGSLCVLLIIALFFTIRALLREKDRRFTDQKALLEVVEKHNEAAKGLAVEATKSQTELQNALSNQTTALSGLTQSVNQLQGRVAG